MISGCARASRRSGLLHYGQGKWYPGEQLPRWAFSLLLAPRRRDDLWRDGDADRSRGERLRRHRRHARELLQGVARAFGARSRARPRRRTRIRGTSSGRNAKLPENLDRGHEPPRRSDGRARGSRRVFERGLGKPVGYVLPVQRWNAAAAATRRWSSEPWTTRAGKLFLVPGDSPLGFRLPLRSLLH